MKPALERLREMVIAILSNCALHYVKGPQDKIDRAIANGVKIALPLAEEQQAAEEWKRVVTDALVVNCILTAEHETNPRKALADLLAWECKCALDPAISKEAANLLREARLTAQQEMRDAGFQHPDDVAKMILSADRRGRLEEAQLWRTYELLGNVPGEIKDKRIAELSAEDATEFISPPSVPEERK